MIIVSKSGLIFKQYRFGAGFVFVRISCISLLNSDSKHDMFVLCQDKKMKIYILYFIKIILGLTAFIFSAYYITFWYFLCQFWYYINHSFISTFRHRLVVSFIRFATILFIINRQSWICNRKNDKVDCDMAFYKMLKKREL